MIINVNKILLFAYLEGFVKNYLWKTNMYIRIYSISKEIFLFI